MLDLINLPEEERLAEIKKRLAEIKRRQLLDESKLSLSFEEDRFDSVMGSEHTIDFEFQENQLEINIDNPWVEIGDYLGVSAVITLTMEQVIKLHAFLSRIMSCPFYRNFPNGCKTDKQIKGDDLHAI